MKEPAAKNPMPLPDFEFAALCCDEAGKSATLEASGYSSTFSAKALRYVAQALRAYRMKEHDMADHLRHAILDIRYEGGPNVSEKLADAIRAEIDLRIDMALVEHMANAEAHIKDAPVSVAKPQAAEPRECLCKYAIVQPPGDGGVVIHDERCFDAPYQRPKPRRNPYADWEMWDNENRIFTPRDLRKVRFQAWNEGAQIAGQRDE